MAAQTQSIGNGGPRYFGLWMDDLNETEAAWDFFFIFIFFLSMLTRNVLFCLTFIVKRMRTTAATLFADWILDPSVATISIEVMMISVLVPACLAPRLFLDLCPDHQCFLGSRNVFYS